VTDDTWFLIALFLAFFLGGAAGFMVRNAVDEPRCSRPCCEEDDEQA
jgi:hypothetical protein